jgi:hypothetical protein
LKNGPGGFAAALLGGGVGSQIGGGKFFNGAVTASFGYLFNAMSQGGPTTALTTNEVPTEGDQSINGLSPPAQSSDAPIEQLRNEDLLLAAGGQDKWYGYNNSAFRDWVHQQKQDWGIPGGHQFDKNDLKGLHQEWKEQGEPRGKGGKSGGGGKTRGMDKRFRPRGGWGGNE